MAVKRKTTRRSTAPPVDTNRCYFCGERGSSWRAKVRDLGGNWIVGAQYTLCGDKCPKLPPGERGKLHQFIPLSAYIHLEPAEQYKLLRGLKRPGA